MKKLYHVLIFLVFASYSFGQAAPLPSFRVVITNPSDVPTVVEKGDGTLSINFSNPMLSNLFDSYTITRFEKEFFLFQDHPILKDVFFVECDNINLMTSLQSANVFPTVELIEGPTELIAHYPTEYPGGVGLYSGYDLINIPEAWGITQGNPSIKVGVTDSNLPTDAASMADLVDNLEYVVGNPYFGSGITHGTEVLRIVGATPDNTAPIILLTGAGIAYNCKMYYGYMGSTWVMQDMVARGARVINGSWTSGTFYSTIDQIFYDEMADKGIICVFAAGNGNWGTSANLQSNGTYFTSFDQQQVTCGLTTTVHENGYFYPASYQNVISVATVLPDDNLVKTNINQYDCNGDGTNETDLTGTVTLNDQVDILAPAGFGFATSGTAPVISGIVALMLSVNPDLKTPEVIEILQTTGVDIRPLHNNNSYFQAGVPVLDKLQDIVRRVDAEAAVQEAKNRFLADLGPVLYSKITTGPHVNTNTMSHFNWVDYDNDNDLDLHDGVPRLTPEFPTYDHFMFSNNGTDPSSFIDISLLGLEAESDKQETNISWSDFDKDGDKDLLTLHSTLTNDDQRYYMYENNGNSSFTKTNLFTIPFITNQRAGGHAIADFDNDGILDMIVGFRTTAQPTPLRVPLIYKGDGTGNYTPVNVSSALNSMPFDVRGFTTGDLDGDGDIDLVSSAANPVVRVFINDGGFSFHEVAIPYYPNLSVTYNSVLVDYDNDTDLDIYVGGTSEPIIYNNILNERFRIVEILEFTEGLGFSNGRDTWADYDNDGDLDLYRHTLGDKAIYKNFGNGTYFTKATAEPTNAASEASHESWGAAFGDGNCDGFVDLYVNNAFLADNTNYYYENQKNSNSWLTIKLEGGASPASAEGTKITAATVFTVSNPNITFNQFREVNTDGGEPHDVYFGFGAYTGQVRLTIEWTSGLVETVYTDLNRIIKIEEGLGIVDADCQCTQAIPPTGPEISGNVGFDANANCDCDDNNDGIADAPLANQWVQITEDLSGNNVGDTYYVNTDASGNYAIELPAGDYNISPIIPDPLYNSDNCGGNPNNLPPNEYDVTTGPNSTDNVFCLGGVDCDFEVLLFANYNGIDYTTPCTNVAQEYCVSIDNNGVGISNPTLTINLDPGVTFQSITNSGCFTNPIYNSTTNTITATLGSIPAQGSCQLCFNVLVTAPLGSTLSTTATLTPGVGSCAGTPAESGTLNETVLCAYDPNDKLLISPESCGPENNIGMNDDLIYRVRFQNEGNAPAINIFITDMLDSDLDFTSLKLLASSHEVDQLLIMPNNQLVFKMNQIFLAPKDLDEAASKGYILFSIKPLPNRAEGTIIENTAFIYFDLNEAVVTNTTINTLRSSPKPEANFSAMRACKALDMRYDFTYTGATPDGATYLWDFGTGASPQTSTMANPIGILFGSAGTKNVTLTVTRYGCTASITIPVEVSSPIGCKGFANRVLLCKDGKEFCVPIQAAINMLATDNFCVGECNGNKSLELEAITFDVFPNPTTGIVTIAIPEELARENPTLEICDVQGKVLKVLETIDATYVEADLSAYANGVYLIRINTTSFRGVERIVKQ